MKEPKIDELSVTFYQDSDCMDTADQQLTIEAKDGGGGWFYVLKTERWAVDRPSEITELLDKVKRMVADKEK